MSCLDAIGWRNVLTADRVSTAVPEDQPCGGKVADAFSTIEHLQMFETTGKIPDDVVTTNSVANKLLFSHPPRTYSKRDANNSEPDADECHPG